MQGKKIGIFLATGLGNIDEILPFITQVFKHDGGFPSPNQFANSVSNAAAFFLARVCDVKGVVLTISQEELSFESALWLAQSYLASGEIDLALVGGCDVFTPTIEDYRERMNLKPGNYRARPDGRRQFLAFIGRQSAKRKSVTFCPSNWKTGWRTYSKTSSDDLLKQCERLAAGLLSQGEDHKISRLFLPGFRLSGIDEASWKTSGWDIDDYLPHCGISSTASAYGLARALLSRKSTLIVHCNHHATGRQALVAAVTTVILWHPPRQKKRIVLVHPRGFNWFPGKRDITDIANRMVPQGMLSIAAYLLREGHDVFVYDCLGPGAPVDMNQQVQAILAFQPQMVGFSTTTSSFPDAADIAQKIKEQNPDIVTVCGGVHVSALREKLLAFYPAFDYFVAGEGEVTMSELAAGVDPVCYLRSDPQAKWCCRRQ